MFLSSNQQAGDPAMFACSMRDYPDRRRQYELPTNRSYHLAYGQMIPPSDQYLPTPEEGFPLLKDINANPSPLERYNYS